MFHEGEAEKVVSWLGVSCVCVCVCVCVGGSVCVCLCEREGEGERVVTTPVTTEVKKTEASLVFASVLYESRTPATPTPSYFFTMAGKSACLHHRSRSSVVTLSLPLPPSLSLSLSPPLSLVVVSS